MATVKINRELLTDLVDDLSSRHIVDFSVGCCRRGVCPTMQRLERLGAALRRDNAEELAAEQADGF